MKKIRYGITTNNDGEVVYAAVYHSRRGWKLKKVRRWNSSSYLRNYMLLDKRLNLGLRCHWIRKKSPDYDLNDLLVVSGEDPSFTVCVDRLDYDHLSDTFKNNIEAVFPDDALLLTLPIHFIEDCRTSFISIFNDVSTIKIGIILNMTLVAVFNVKAKSQNELDGHIGRIERYLSMVFQSKPALEARYVINNPDFYDCTKSGALIVPCGSSDPATLKAMGCALCGGKGSVTLLSGPTIESRFRKVRKYVFYGALLISFISVLLSSSFLAVGLYIKTQVSEVKKSYQNILTNNNEIRELIADGERLSRRIIRINERTSNKTTWGPFLQSIGSLRPAGLYFERLGSEPVSKSDSRMRIALAGWCENETIVTSFIKALKEIRSLSGVTLTSMERINPNQTACRFKIICILSTLKN